MIQRIQTLYFFIALVLLSLPLFGMNLYSVKLDQLGTTIMDVTAYNVESAGGSVQKVTLWIYVIVPVLATLITLITFKSRDKQLTLSRMSMVIVALVCGWIFFTGIQFLSKSEYPKNHGVIPGIALYLMAGSIVFLFLGMRGVKKDKKLIDSLDRLR